ncbi:hypothetical protein FO519_010805, partial [Halicephalobus sp. NKZ332]
MFIRLLPLKQIVFGFPNDPEFHKKEPNAMETLEKMEGLVQYLSEIKEIEEYLIIKATAFNTLEYLPKIKPIEDKIEESKQDGDESEEEEDDLERFSEIFEAPSNDIIKEYEREIESLRANLCLSESLLSKVVNFQPAQIVEDDWEEESQDE